MTSDAETTREEPHMATLKGKTLFISGASRGIGLAIALRAARDGANIAIAAKTETPHPKLEGTIYTAAEQIEKAGGRALPLVVDVRDEEAVKAGIDKTAQTFGGIDIVVNNASAVSRTPVAETDMKRYDLMNGINARGTYLSGRVCIPHLQKSAAAGRNPHILTLSPPLDMRTRWFAPHVAYSMAKYGMSLCTLGWAEEFKRDGIAANSLWPRTLIATAALNVAAPGEAMRARKPEIMADAAHHILTLASRSVTGRFFLDEAVLREAGVSDFEVYAMSPGTEPEIDLFVGP